jgi:hypothetical protein
MKRGLIAVAAVVAVVAIVVVSLPTDTPIYISDGSVKFYSGGVTKKSATELVVNNLLSKVSTITVANDDTSDLKSYTVAKKTNWQITSDNTPVTVIPSTYGLGETVTITCPSGWKGNGKYYVCATSGQFTPATFLNNGSPTPLTCTTKKCMVELDY